MILKPLEALSFTVSKYERLQGLMEEESGEAFDISDTRAALVYVTPDGPQTAWLPVTREEQQSFVMSINALPETTAFPGVIFYQFDKAAKPGVEQHIFWVLQLMAGPLAEEVLRVARDEARAGKVPWRGN
jgi:hypothetical protein